MLIRDDSCWQHCQKLLMCQSWVQGTFVLSDFILLVTQRQRLVVNNTFSCSLDQTYTLYRIVDSLAYESEKLP
jgi:hypothetical protein